MLEGWLERAGVRLHYIEWEPDGPAREPALFLLHGLSSNALVWSRLGSALRDRRLVALDQRSHGLSDRPPEGYSSAELVEDATTAIRELGLGRPLLAGHSWGASIALELAATHPELASGLVFVDGPTTAVSRFMSWEETLVRMQPPLPIYANLGQAIAAQLEYLGDAWADDLVPFVRAGLVEVDGGLASTLTAHVRRQILEMLYNFDPLLFFPGVAGPVLVAVAAQLWPGASQEFAELRRRAVEAVVAVRGDARVRWYDSRHDIPVIRPQELGADIERTAAAAVGAPTGD